MPRFDRGRHGSQALLTFYRVELVISKPRLLVGLSLAAVGLLLPSCGSGSSPVSATPTTTMPAGSVTTLFAGTQANVQPGAIVNMPVNAPTAGVLTATLSWAVASNVFGAQWAQGATCPPCSQINTSLTTNSASTTSGVAAASVAQGGAYVLEI